MISSDMIAIIVVGIAFVALRLLEKRIGHRIGESFDHNHYEREIERLKSQIKTNSDKYEIQIGLLKEQIDFLISELAKTKGEIRQNSLEISNLSKTKNVLLVCGNADFCSNDRNALQRAGIDFTTIKDATKGEIRRRMQRAREDSKPIRFVHISAHGNDQAIVLTDGPADGKWWNDVLVGVEIVFLASCHSAGVADWLATSGRAVIETDTEVSDENAYTFAYLFWRAVVEGKGAAEAFSIARDELPAIADSVSIRVRN